MVTALVQGDYPGFTSMVNITYRHQLNQAQYWCTADGALFATYVNNAKAAIRQAIEDETGGGTSSTGAFVPNNPGGGSPGGQIGGGVGPGQSAGSTQGIRLWLGYDAYIRDTSGTEWRASGANAQSEISDGYVIGISGALADFVEQYSDGNWLLVAKFNSLSYPPQSSSTTSTVVLNVTAYPKSMVSVSVTKASWQVGSEYVELAQRYTITNTTNRTVQGVRAECAVTYTHHKVGSKNVPDVNLWDLEYSEIGTVRTASINAGGVENVYVYNSIGYSIGNPTGNGNSSNDYGSGNGNSNGGSDNIENHNTYIDNGDTTNITNNVNNTYNYDSTTNNITNVEADLTAVTERLDALNRMVSQLGVDLENDINALIAEIGHFESLVHADFDTYFGATYTWLEMINARLVDILNKLDNMGGVGGGGSTDLSAVNAQLADIDADIEDLGDWALRYWDWGIAKARRAKEIVLDIGADVSAILAALEDLEITGGSVDLSEITDELNEWHNDFVGFWGDFQNYMDDILRALENPYTRQRDPRDIPTVTQLGDKIDLSPLLSALARLMTKFPFAQINDIVLMLTALARPAVVPVFDLPMPNPSDWSSPYSVRVDLSDWSTAAAIVRTGIMLWATARVTRRTMNLWTREEQG